MRGARKGWVLTKRSGLFAGKRVLRWCSRSSGKAKMSFLILLLCATPLWFQRARPRYATMFSLLHSTASTRSLKRKCRMRSGSLSKAESESLFSTFVEIQVDFCRVRSISQVTSFRLDQLWCERISAKEKRNASIAVPDGSSRVLQEISVQMRW